MTRAHQAAPGFLLRRIGPLFVARCSEASSVANPRLFRLYLYIL